MRSSDSKTIKAVVLITGVGGMLGCGPRALPAEDDAGTSETADEGPGEETGDGDGDESGEETGDGDGDGDGDPGPSCGDGTLDPQEACDDGNTLDGDGCSAICELSGGALLETLGPGPDWPATAVALTLATADGEPFLLLGGHSQSLVGEVRIVRLSLTGASSWSADVPPVPEIGRTMTAVEAIDDTGAAWVTGSSTTFGFPMDPTPIIEEFWIGRLEADGTWAWLTDTPFVSLATDLIVREDGGGVVLVYTYNAGAELTSFSSAGELEWLTPSWGNDRLNERADALARTSSGLVTGGKQEIGGLKDLWLSQFSADGELIGHSVHASPNFASASVKELAYDPLTDTLAALVSETGGHFAWVRLDPTGETVLAWRSIDLGLPVQIEPDGVGGAYVLSDHDDEGLRLGHYAADPDQPALWSGATNHTPIDLAVDHEGGRAYVLTETGIDVLML